MKKLALVISIGLLTACGGSSGGSSISSSESSSDPLPAEIKELKGSWQSPCEIDSEDNDSDNNIETYSGNKVSFKVTNYVDSDCTNTRLSMKFSATVSYEGERILSSGQTVKKVKAVYDTSSILVLIQEESLQNEYIEKKICGRTDWNKEKYIEISSCNDLSDVKKSLKDPQKEIYYVDGNQAFWGDVESNLSEDGYPTTLDSKPNTRIQ